MKNLVQLHMNYYGNSYYIKKSNNIPIYSDNQCILEFEII